MRIDICREIQCRDAVQQLEQGLLARPDHDDAPELPVIEHGAVVVVVADPVVTVHGDDDEAHLQAVGRRALDDAAVCGFVVACIGRLAFDEGEEGQGVFHDARVQDMFWMTRCELTGFGTQR